MQDMDSREKVYVSRHLIEALRHLEQAMEVLVQRGDQSDFLIISPVTHIIEVVNQRVLKG